MIGWPLSRSCAVAWRFGDESQQPILPHVMHMRRCTQPLPIFRHSSHPSIVLGQLRHLDLVEVAADGIRGHVPLLVSAGGQDEGDGEIARRVCPPRSTLNAGAVELRFERVSPELRADLDAKPLALLERESSFERRIATVCDPRARSPMSIHSCSGSQRGS